MSSGALNRNVLPAPGLLRANGRASNEREERRRLEVFARVQRGEMSLSEAAQLLKLSYRQVRRIRNRFVQAGDAGLIHQEQSWNDGGVESIMMLRGLWVSQDQRWDDYWKDREGYVK